MFYALPSKILVTHGAMVDAQRVKRPVLIAQSTPVAVQSEPGVALGGPLRRADVAFVSVALVHGAPAKPGHVKSSHVVPRLAAANRAISCHILSPLWGVSLPCPTVSRQVRPRTAVPDCAVSSRTEPCPANRPYGRVLARSSLIRPRLVTPGAALSSPAQPIALTGVSMSCRAGDCRAAPDLVLPSRAEPNTAVPCRPYGRIHAQPDRAEPNPATPHLALPRRTKPSLTTSRFVALAGRIHASPDRTTPYSTGANLALPRLAQPSLTTSRLVALTGVSLPCLNLSCRSRTRPIVPRPAIPHRSIPCCPYGHIPAQPNHASSRRAVSCLARPNLAVPCRDQRCIERKNPNTCALVGLLKTHGGCTDVRIVDHEPQQNSPRDVSLQQFQYTRNGRPCQQGVACERT